jgi:hypothetical protein
VKTTPQANQDRKGLNWSEKRIVEQYLRKTIDDPSSFEIAEWLEPRFVLTGKNSKPFVHEGQPAIKDLSPDVFESYSQGTIVHVKWRERNRSGAKILREGVFLVCGDSVLRGRSVGEGEWRGAPHQLAFADSIRELGYFAAMSCDGKQELAVVRGKVTLNGVPVKNSYWISFCRLTSSGGSEEIYMSDILYEIAKEGHYEENIRDRHDPFSFHSLVSPPRYEVSGLPAGNYLVAIEINGVIINRQCLVSASGEIQTVDFELKKEDLTPKPKPKNKEPETPKVLSKVDPFNNNILPIFKAKCIECHGAKPKGGLDVRTVKAMIVGGNSGTALQAGDPDNSELWKYIKNDEMPPGNKAKLTATEKKLIMEWIASGAK